MVQRIEEPDMFAGMGNIDRNILEGSRHAGKVGPVIDDRDHPRGRVVIPGRMFFEKVHSLPRDRTASFTRGLAAPRSRSAAVSQEE